MIRQFMFDLALFTKRIGSIWAMVGIEISYIIFGVFFGIVEMKHLFTVISIVQILLTCMLFQIVTISQGELLLELNTEKAIYFPTTRLNYLKSKYLITILLLCFQTLITFICLGLGYLGNRGHLGMDYVVGSLLVVLINVLFSSGIIILVMHMNPITVYLPLVLTLPLNLISNGIIYLLNQKYYNILFLVAIFSVFLWILMLHVGNYIYEKR
jgi:hypothetical protein